MSESASPVLPEDQGGRRTTSTLRVRDELRDAILTGRLQPGARLRAEPLARQLATSRTPIREALVLLARDGLVELEPRRGAVVKSFDRADLLDLYEVRALIEPYAALRAASRIRPEALARLEQLCDLAESCDTDEAASVEDQIAFNDEFHRLIADAAGSPRLTAALGAVAGIPHAFRAMFWQDAEQRALSHTRHREVLDALRAGRPQLAEAAMRMHILAATELLAVRIP